VSSVEQFTYTDVDGNTRNETGAVVAWGDDSLDMADDYYAGVPPVGGVEVQRRGPARRIGGQAPGVGKQVRRGTGPRAGQGRGHGSLSIRGRAEAAFAFDSATVATQGAGAPDEVDGAPHGQSRASQHPHVIHACQHAKPPGRRQ